MAESVQSDKQFDGQIDPEIAERLGLGGDAAGQVKKTVKKMVRAGELEFGPNHLVLPMDPDHPARESFGPPKPPKGEGPTVIGGEGPAAAGKPAPEGKKGRRGRSKDYIVGTLRRVGLGRVGGGTSVNSVPFETWMEVDMRSESPQSLARIEQAFLDAMDRRLREENQLRREGEHPPEGKNRRDLRHDRRVGGRLGQRRRVRHGGVGAR